MLPEYGKCRFPRSIGRSGSYGDFYGDFSVDQLAVSEFRPLSSQMSELSSWNQCRASIDVPGLEFSR
jgi:hypothetical protein